MEKEKIATGNRLIADYMQVERCTAKEHADNPCYYFTNAYNKIEDAKYHSDWNWLMPVIEKISKHRFESPETFREAVWKAVVEFIEHNQTKNEKS